MWIAQHYRLFPGSTRRRVTTAWAAAVLVLTPSLCPKLARETHTERLDARRARERDVRLPRREAAAQVDNHKVERRASRTRERERERERERKREKDGEKNKVRRRVVVCIRTRQPSPSLWHVLDKQTGSSIHCWNSPRNLPMYRACETGVAWRGRLCSLASPCDLWIVSAQASRSGTMKRSHVPTLKSSR